MKFSTKLMLCIIVIIATILSCSRFVIIKQNFIHSIETISIKNMKQCLAERYYLESKIVNYIEIGEEVTNENIVEYIKSLYLYLEDNTQKIALFTEDKEILYSNFELISEINIDDFSKKETESYVLKKIGDKQYMFFSSYWDINKEIIYTINIYDITEIYEERNRQLNEIMFADFIILAISSIFIVIFSTLFTKPIRQLNMTSKKISTGDFSQRVKIKSKDEVGELANSFNIMSEQIENKINSLNLSIKQKNDFINAFTHELKTPLTSIIGYSDMLRLKKCDEKLTQKALNYIYTESKRLELLSYKLMNLMSLSENKIEIEDVSVKQFINKVISKIILKEIEIKADIEQGFVKADKQLLEVVIRNLVENSKKANPKDNLITIKGEIVGNAKYKISVIDKGCGIPKEHIERVTEDFYMVDKSRSKENGGSGIGLSICKKILEVHKSNLEIESEESIGTIVSFKLDLLQ